MKNLCPTCRHYKGSLVCVAFPNGIPSSIASGTNNHEKVMSTQKGEFIYSEGKQKYFFDVNTLKWK